MRHRTSFLVLSTNSAPGRELAMRFVILAAIMFAQLAVPDESKAQDPSVPQDTAIWVGTQLEQSGVAGLTQLCVGKAPAENEHCRTLAASDFRSILVRLNQPAEHTSEETSRGSRE